VGALTTSALAVNLDPDAGQYHQLTNTFNHYGLNPPVFDRSIETYVARSKACVGAGAVPCSYITNPSQLCGPSSSGSGYFTCAIPLKFNMEGDPNPYYSVTHGTLTVEVPSNQGGALFDSGLAVLNKKSSLRLQHIFSITNRGKKPLSSTKNIAPNTQNFQAVAIEGPFTPKAVEESAALAINHKAAFATVGEAATQSLVNTQPAINHLAKAKTPIHLLSLATDPISTNTAAKVMKALPQTRIVAFGRFKGNGLNSINSSTIFDHDAATSLPNTSYQPKNFSAMAGKLYTIDTASHKLRQANSKDLSAFPELAQEQE